MEHGNQQPNGRWQLISNIRDRRKTTSRRKSKDSFWALGKKMGQVTPRVGGVFGHEQYILIRLRSEFFEVSLFHKLRLMEFGSWRELWEHVLGKAIPLCCHSSLEAGRDSSKNLRLHIMFKGVQNLLFDFYFTILRILISDLWIMPSNALNSVKTSLLLPGSLLPDFWTHTHTHTPVASWRV